LKFQITNPKKQTNNNDQNSKFQTKKNNRFEPVWNLDFEIYLEIGAWDLLFKTPSSNANLENSDLAQRTRFFKAK